MEWDDLEGLFPGFESPRRWLELLRRHAGLIEEGAARTRVTAVAPGEAVRRHYAESLETWRVALECAARMPERAADVGSGGGFPGMVMACVAPEVRFALVEPLRKRAALLAEMAETLGLGNVEVIAQRAEDAGRAPLRHSAGIVTARAVAALPELLEYTAPFAATGGRLCLPKGSGWQAELASAGGAMRELGCAVVETTPMRPAISTTIRVLVFEQLAATPERFPRRAGVPGKRPLS